MLVILIDNKRVLPGAICRTCPMASQSGQPRWQAGQLRCGRPTGRELAEKVTTRDCDRIEGSDEGSERGSKEGSKDARTQYECIMGFRIAELLTLSPNPTGIVGDS
ncbi:MAG: hypothetical protein WBA01_06935 [Phormidesmis sp.]